MTQKWEYLRVTRTRMIKERFAHTDTLPWNCEIEENKLGREGWELVTIASYTNSMGANTSAGQATDEMWVFKRPAG